MSTVLVFDLDDTLYEERLYVEGGLRAVADFGAKSLGLDRNKSFAAMLAILEQNGRGAVFDTWLKQEGIFTKGLVQECLRKYRAHSPEIVLNDFAQIILPKLEQMHPLYIVTDGNKLVQRRKIEALGIEPFFRRVLISHRFGVKNAKPSLYCFAKIQAAEACNWCDMIYVADNPRKDFVALNKMGAITIRVSTGPFRDELATQEYDAKYRISDLSHLFALLVEMGRG